MCIVAIGESLLGDSTNTTNGNNDTTHIYPTYPTHVAEGIVYAYVVWVSLGTPCDLCMCVHYLCPYVCSVYVCMCPFVYVCMCTRNV